MAYKKLNKESVPEAKEISMRIRQISITGLFGVFNHVIPLNSDERITIIHAPNGYGKTIMLKMLDGLFNDRHYELLTIPYENFQVEFEDGSRLKLDKVGSSKIDSKKSEMDFKKINLILNFYKKAEEESIHHLNLEYDSCKTYNSSPFDDHNLSIQQAPQEIWRYRYPVSSPGSPPKVSARPPFSDFRHSDLDDERWFIQLKKIVHVYLIESQRLFSFSESRNERRYPRDPNASPALTVDSYSAELVAQIKERLAKYASVSQSLDRSFPTRLLKQSNSNELTSEELLLKLEDLEKKRNGLIETGLLEQDEHENPQIIQDEIHENMRNILSVYVGDVEEKLRVFDKITGKINLFRRIINSKFSYKEIIIDREKGFIFKSKYPDEYQGCSDDLSPDSLSSGEQHELVLLYELLFKVPEKSLVLIDEPELSLHVGWQVSFLRDLEEIVNLVDLDLLIATHSPSIVHGRWDLTVELKGLPQ